MIGALIIGVLVSANFKPVGPQYENQQLLVDLETIALVSKSDIWRFEYVVANGGEGAIKTLYVNPHRNAYIAVAGHSELSEIELPITRWRKIISGEKEELLTDYVMDVVLGSESYFKLEELFSSSAIAFLEEKNQKWLFVGGLYSKRPSKTRNGVYKVWVAVNANCGAESKRRFGNYSVVSREFIVEQNLIESTSRECDYYDYDIDHKVLDSKHSCGAWENPNPGSYFDDILNNTKRLVGWKRK